MSQEAVSPRTFLLTKYSAQGLYLRNLFLLRSYLLCVLELHLGPREEAGPVLKKQDQSYVFPTSQIFRA
jgi:hypothetical protein